MLAAATSDARLPVSSARFVELDEEERIEVASGDLGRDLSEGVRLCGRATEGRKRRLEAGSGQRSRVSNVI